ncbi:bifunctional alpha/beta hydrolase/class I SAM-dependent methyltransferase [Vibrio sp. TRT 17S01]|uniref:bifunctional alpha/beta hydrolase/class I SAM-dependent methyltransferase n=1 Tax=Vibrio sp. TRT 17S01 TaxID=3418505 RepID=UPI003CF28CD1
MTLDHQYFNSWDNTKIIYRSWNLKPDTKGIILLLHRGHEHSERMAAMADFFVEQNYTVYAWDARGNGLSEGPRDDAESFSVFARDLQLFVEVITQETKWSTEEMLIVASSMGALIATSWVHDYAPNIRGMILATPAFNIRLYVPFAIPLLKAARKLSLLPRVSSYVKSKVLTHDRAQQAIYNQDRLISSSISTDLLIDTYQTGQRLIDDASAIHTPTLLLCAGQDWVVSRSAQRRFYNRLSSDKKEWCYYPDLYHAIFHEDKTKEVYQRCKHFIEECFSQPLIQVNYDNADNYGVSKDKMDSCLLPSLNPIYPITKATLNSLGRLSQGIQIGLKHGFDSGQSLDYVYTDQAQGRSFVGKIIDRIYLDSPGWLGIRCRKAIINQLLDKYLKKTQTSRVLDVASGNGRYLFDLMQSNPLIFVEMRDFDDTNVHIMRSRIESMALGERAQAIQADAFNKDSYDSESNFDLAIVSGLFELFSDNDLISTAIKGMANQLAPGGYLLYTNQPWHPQQEFIAKTLRNHRGQPWVMRCRSQAEMDSLITEAGLKKVDMIIDSSGIFSVSIAQKCD